MFHSCSASGTIDLFYIRTCLCDMINWKGIIFLVRLSSKAGSSELFCSTLNIFKMNNQINENISEIYHLDNKRNCATDHDDMITLPATLHKYTTKQNLLLQYQKICEIQQRQLHEQQQQQQSQPHQNQSLPEWYFYQHQKTSAYHRNSRHHNYKKKGIIQLNSHVQQHLQHYLQQYHHKCNNHIFHKTHHLSNNKLHDCQMKEMMLYVV